jgi:hypothetical protein
MTGDEYVVEENVELGPFLLEPASLGNLNNGSPLKRRRWRGSCFDEISNSDISPIVIDFHRLNTAPTPPSLISLTITFF